MAPIKIQMIPRRSFYHFGSSSGKRHRRQLLSQKSLNQQLPLVVIPRHSIGWVAGVLKSVLKIRYLILGSAVGGGIHLNNKYKELKDKLPDFDWIKEIFPDQEKRSNMKDSLINLRDKLTSDNKFFSSLSASTQETIEQFRQMLKERQKKELYLLSENGGGTGGYHHDDSSSSSSPDLGDQKDLYVQQIKNPFASKESSSPGENISAGRDDKTRIDKLQAELIRIQNKYQKEVDRLEDENKKLRKSLLLKTDNSKVSENLKKANKTLIDLYSDVLDELNDFDSSYNTQDHLPRVIVVGDQSAGKTSVLEMIAHARIFPRGAGEMMTRSPVKVTLKEGPYHIARFKDSEREYDLTKENELADLRAEIEARMKAKVKNGRSVSKDVIPLTVEGPGLPRMVLIDLPGVISTVTTEMASDTRKEIEEITNFYMNNPNAIILCVQDGSVDAERSIVTDLVSQVDPQGKRTIFVLTKIDLAEKNMSDPTRLKKILEGKLFPMKALGYFAVVTGRGGKDDSIQSIKEYEEKFFKESKLCKQGILNTSQCSTHNLSFAVSECFWKMVKSAVEQQADLYKARKFNLETEWKNKYSKYRELDRDELFEIGKNQILDQIIKLSHFNELHWETLFFNKLNENFRGFVFREIYLPCAECSETENFNVMTDIKLKNWVDNQLPIETVKVGWEVLREQFRKILFPNDASKSDKNKDDNDESDEALFKNLKHAVVENVAERHQWDSKANDVLKLLQMNSSEDRIVSSKEKWKESSQYWRELVLDQIRASETRLRDLIGPDWRERWMSWTSRTTDQIINVNIKNELENLLINSNGSKPTLDSDDMLLVKKNLRIRKIEVSDDDINLVWKELYRNYFLNNLLNKTYNCEKLYAHHMYKLDSDISCDDVVFFYRIRHILLASSKALRQQTTNTEIQRLNREVKETLDDFGHDYQKKASLLKGKRVELAEELKRVRRIQEKLEEFIEALNKEK